MATTNTTRTWPELAVGLLDQLTARAAAIAHQFAATAPGIPSAASPDADVARWHLNGTVRVTTRRGVES